MVVVVVAAAAAVVVAVVVVAAAAAAAAVVVVMEVEEQQLPCRERPSRLRQRMRTACGECAGVSLCVFALCVADAATPFPLVPLPNTQRATRCAAPCLPTYISSRAWPL